MEGDLSLVSVPDLLQMICIGGYNRDLHLFDGPTQLGVIAIRRGQVDRCFGFGMWGEQAFYKLVNVRRGRYKVNEAQDTSSASDASLIAHSWQELLMEAARLEDEAELAKQQAAAATGRVIAFPSPPAAFEISGLSFTEPTRETRPPTTPPATAPAPAPAPIAAVPSMPSRPLRQLGPRRLGRRRRRHRPPGDRRARERRPQRRDVSAPRRYRRDARRGDDLLSAPRSGARRTDPARVPGAAAG
jgi:hypothetical protein